MGEQTEFERQSRALLLELDKEQDKLAKRVVTAQEALAAVEHKRNTIREALRIYCETYNIPFNATEMDEGLRRRFQDVTPKDALLQLADDAAGDLIISNVCRTLVRAGMFKDMRNASGSIYSTLARYPQVFEKIAKGRYRVRRTQPNHRHREMGPISVSAAEVVGHPARSVVVDPLVPESAPNVWQPGNIPEAPHG